MLFKWINGMVSHWPIFVYFFKISHQTDLQNIRKSRSLSRAGWCIPGPVGPQSPPGTRRLAVETQEAWDTPHRPSQTSFFIIDNDLQLIYKNLGCFSPQNTTGTGSRHHSQLSMSSAGYHTTVISARLQAGTREYWLRIRSKDNF